MIKILYPFHQDPNPYVFAVQEGLRKRGVEVVSRTDLFWENRGREFNVIHFQWPETLFDWRVPSDIELILLEERLKALKGIIPMVYTWHNRVSHHCKPETHARLMRLYQLIADFCDVVVHLGPVSLEEAKQTPGWEEKRHVVIPVPIYDQLYEPYTGVSQADARARLGLPAKGRLVLAFGNFRYPREYDLVRALRSSAGAQRFEVFAPMWFRPGQAGYSMFQPLYTLRSFRTRLQVRRQGILARDWKRITDAQVADCFAASDLVFLQRTEELNSGNLPMACLFRKVLLGPATGNMGAWLRELGNPVFDPNNQESVRIALEKAWQGVLDGLGEQNHTYARLHWSTEKIAESHHALYEKLRTASR
ncbi:MAG: hypothetical protein JJU05_04070 [Verrucomicrobia bacterium]|nr:hypothetical protein [Verrucomicrobiota bacterium]